MDKQTENLAAIEDLALLSAQEAADAVSAGCSFDSDIIAAGCADMPLPAGCADDRLGDSAISTEIVNSLAAGCTVL